MDYGLVVVRTTDRYKVVCRTEEREQLTWGFVVWGERRYIPVYDCLGCVLAAIWVGDGRERERERERRMVTRGKRIRSCQEIITR